MNNPKEYRQKMNELIHKHHSSNGGGSSFKSLKKVPGTYIFWIVNTLAKTGNVAEYYAFHKGVEPFNNNKKVYCPNISSDELGSGCPICAYEYSDQAIADRKQLESLNDSKAWSKFYQIKPTYTANTFILRRENKAINDYIETLAFFNDDIEAFNKKLLDSVPVGFDWLKHPIKMTISKHKDEKGYERNKYEFTVASKESPIPDDVIEKIKDQIGNTSIVDTYKITPMTNEKLNSLLSMFRKGFGFSSNNTPGGDDVGFDDGFDESNYSNVGSISDSSDDGFGDDIGFDDGDVISESDDDFGDLEDLN